MEGSGRQVDDLPRLEGLRSGAHACWVVDPCTPFEEWAAACLAEGGHRREKLFRFGPERPAGVVGVDPRVGWPVTDLDPWVAFLDRGRIKPAVTYGMFRDQTAAARREGCRGLRADPLDYT